MRKIVFPIFIAAMSFAANAKAKEITEVVDSSHVYELDEVCVVHQPKEQFLLRRQGVSSTMLSAKDMFTLHATDLRELSSYVPNFVMPKYGSRYTSAMYVRGIGSRINSPAVGIYVDGMPLMSKSSFNTFFHDISRVDILRGPQGTLYGLNTEGGLVRIYSRNPISEPGFEWGRTIATHGLISTNINLRRRISDKAGFSIAGFFVNDQGYLRNHLLDTKADKSQEAGGRFKFVYAPSATSYLNAIVDFQHTHQNAFPYGAMADDDTTDNPNTNQQGRYRRNMLNAAIDFGTSIGSLNFSSTTSYQHLYDFMAMDIDYMPVDYLAMNEKQRQNSITQEFVLKGNYRNLWRHTSGIFGSVQWLKTDAPVFFNQGMDEFLASNIQRPMYAAILASMTGRFLAQGMTSEAATAAAQAVIERAGGITVDADMHTVPGLFHTPTLNLGFYHESSVQLANRLAATLGVRYDWSRVGVDYDTQAIMDCNVSVMGRPANTRISSTLRHKEHNNYGQLLPKVSLVYSLDDSNSNLYATISKGYRAGGFNIQMFSDILQTEISNSSSQRGDYDVPHDEASYDNIRKSIEYKPETSWNYEVGSHLNLFNGALHLDAAVFFMQVKNQQLSVMAGTYGFGRMMVNAGRSNSCGVELSLRGSAFDNHLSYTASYGFTHATFREYTDSVKQGRELVAVDYKGKSVPFVPNHTFAASADWRFDIAHRWLNSITIGANIAGQGRNYWDEANTRSQKAYAVLGAHVDFKIRRFDFNFWATNITNTHYNTFAISSQATGTNHWFAQRATPFRFGVDWKTSL